jgi:hypothetical protein
MLTRITGLIANGAATILGVGESAAAQDPRIVDHHERPHRPRAKLVQPCHHFLSVALCSAPFKASPLRSATAFHGASGLDRACARRA